MLCREIVVNLIRNKRSKDLFAVVVYRDAECKFVPISDRVFVGVSNAVFDPVSVLDREVFKLPGVAEVESYPVLKVSPAPTRLRGYVNIGRCEIKILIEEQIEPTTDTLINRRQSILS